MVSRTLAHVGNRVGGLPCGRTRCNTVSSILPCSCVRGLTRSLAQVGERRLWFSWTVPIFALATRKLAHVGKREWHDNLRSCLASSVGQPFLDTFFFVFADMHGVPQTASSAMYGAGQQLNAPMTTHVFRGSGFMPQIPVMQAPIGFNGAGVQTEPEGEPQLPPAQPKAVSQHEGEPDVPPQAGESVPSNVQEQLKILRQELPSDV